MRLPAVVDSNVIIAALLRRDTNHLRGLEILLAIDEGRLGRIELTDFLLAEVLNYLNRKAGPGPARDALHRIDNNPAFRTVRLSDSSYETGKNSIFPSNHRLSFVDALTVAHMREREIGSIYSFDSDFDGVRGIQRLDSARGGRAGASVRRRN